MMSPLDIRPPHTPHTHTHLKAPQLSAQLPVNKKNTLDHESPDISVPHLKAPQLLAPLPVNEKYIR